MPTKTTVDPLENNDYRLSNMFNGYVFHIPNYQRFYSWTESHCEDLWDDLLNIIEEGRNHYMGTVICKDEDNAVKTTGFGDNYREYAIVDGQQRFTSLVLLTKALISAYEGVDEEELDGESREIYEEIQADSAKTLFVRDSNIEADSQPRYSIQNKLKLQDEDHDIFKGILRDDAKLSDADTPSEERIFNAYNYYTDEIKKLKEENSTAEYLYLLGQLISKIQSLQFMLYTIDTQDEATLIFQSINDRGKGLSNLDKTKSFLMHKVYLNEPEDGGHAGVSIDDVQRRFGRIYKSMQDIEQEERTSGITEKQIQQYHYISQVPRDITKKYLGEETDRNRTLKGGGPVYLDALKWHFNQLYNGTSEGPYEDYARDCGDEIDWYTDGLQRYFSHVSTMATYNKNEKIEWELTKLFALGRLGNFYPLLLTVWDEYEEGTLSDSEMLEILRTIEIGSFRIYSVANKRSDTGESRFYRLANNVAKDGPDVDDIVTNIEGAVSRYETDFGETLRDNNVYSTFSRRDLRYLLYSYDLYIREEGGGGVAPEIEEAVQNAGGEYSIDHIWPQDTSKLSLTEDEEEIHEEVRHNLGNLTLTTGPRNASWKNLPYEEKRDRSDEGGEKKDYASSDFAMTRKVAREYETWGPNKIDSHLDDIVDYAESRWSLNSEERQDFIEIRPHREE